MTRERWRPGLCVDVTPTLASSRRYPQFSSQVRQASNLSEVLASTTGELFWWDGTHLYIKLTGTAIISWL